MLICIHQRRVKKKSNVRSSAKVLRKKRRASTRKRIHQYIWIQQQQKCLLKSKKMFIIKLLRTHILVDQFNLKMLFFVTFFSVLSFAILLRRCSAVLRHRWWRWRRRRRHESEREPIAFPVVILESQLNYSTFLLWHFFVCFVIIRLKTEWMRFFLF